jgi:hypothetical protein
MMSNVKSKISNERLPCTHLAGEYFVAAELSKRGFNVAMTVGNAKKVDLIIEDDEVTLPVQVKAIALKKFVGWPIKLGSSYSKNLIFVLVVLGKVDELPKYYVVDGKEVTKLTKKYKSRAILNITDVKAKENNWTLIEKRLQELRKKL